MDLSGEQRLAERPTSVDIELQVAGGGNVGIEGLRQLHVDTTVADHSQRLVTHEIRGTGHRHIGLRAGDVGLGEVKYPGMQRCPQRSGCLERNSLQGDGELVDLRVSAELLRLPQRTGHVDRAPNGRIAGDTLHMKSAQDGGDIEVVQYDVCLRLKVATQGRLAFDL
jgi:hypothetical protein